MPTHNVKHQCLTNTVIASSINIGNHFHEFLPTDVNASFHWAYTKLYLQIELRSINVHNIRSWRRWFLALKIPIQLELIIPTPCRLPFTTWALGPSLQTQSDENISADTTPWGGSSEWHSSNNEFRQMFKILSSTLVSWSSSEIINVGVWYVQEDCRRLSN